MSAHGPAPRPGDRLGSATLIQAIGSGAMGTVFRARDDDGADVAVKVLHRSDAHARERFRREVSAIQAVGRHPSIVDVVAFDADSACPWLAMEFIDGESLAARLKRRGALEPQELWPLGAAIAEALEFLHSQGLVHRDLKPENVFLRRENGAPVLGDFGLAWREDLQTLTASEESVGTPAYMAPEAFDGGNQRAPSLDIWALGCLLYECATGRPPFHGRTPAELVGLICSQTPPAPSSLSRSISSDADALILACLEKDPACRPRSAAMLAKDLRRLDRGETPESTSTASFGRRAKPSVGLVLTLTLVVVGLLAGTVLVHRHRARTDAHRRAVSELRALKRRLAAELPELRRETDRRYAALLLQRLPGGSEPARSDAISPGLEALRALLERPADSPELKDLRARAWKLPVFVDARRELDLQQGLATSGTDPESLRTALALISLSPEEARQRLRRWEAHPRCGPVARHGRALLEFRLGHHDKALELLPSAGDVGLRELNARLRRTIQLDRWIQHLETPAEPLSRIIRDLDELLTPGFLGANRADSLALLRAHLEARFRAVHERGELTPDDGRALRRCFELLDEHPDFPLPTLPAKALKVWAEALHREGHHGPDQIALALACRAAPELERALSFTVIDWLLLALEKQRSGSKQAFTKTSVRWMSIADALGLALPFSTEGAGLLGRPEIRRWLEKRHRARPDSAVRAAWLERSELSSARDRLQRGEPLLNVLALRDPAAFRKTVLAFAVSDAFKAAILISAVDLRYRFSGSVKVAGLLTSSLTDLTVAESLGSCDPARVLYLRVLLLKRLRSQSGSGSEEIERAAKAALARLQDTERRVAERRLQRVRHPGVWLYPYALNDAQRLRCDLLLTLGALALDRRELGRAEDYARTALKSVSDHVEALALLGLVHLERGRPDEARAILATIPEHCIGQHLSQLRERLE